MLKNKNREKNITLFSLIKIKTHIDVLVLSFLTLLFFSFYTLPFPYFLDTYGYLDWIEQVRETGQFAGGYRLVNNYLYYYPVVLFGEPGLKITTVFIVTLFTFFYGLVIKRDFSRTHSFAATLLLLSAPATVITVTHLKEDFTSLLFFVIAMYLVGKKVNFMRALGAGIFYGLSLLFKELTLAALPFLLAYLTLARHPIGSYKELLKLPSYMLRCLPAYLAFLVGVAIIILWLAPNRYRDFFIMASNPYMGQFMGLFSPQQKVGYHFWNEATLYLYPWYWVALASLAWAIWRPDFKKLLYAAGFVVIFLFLLNISVIRARHFSQALFFVTPLIADGALLIGFALLRLVRKLISTSTPQAEATSSSSPSRQILTDKSRLVLGSFIVLITILLVGLQLRYVIPTLEYRMRYNPQKALYAPLRNKLPADAVFLGMDNCPIASYHSGISCISHKTDLDNQQYEMFVEKIRNEMKNRTVFLLPDFFSYDKKRTLRQRFSKDFELKKVFTGLSEDYHAMTYGHDVDDFSTMLIRRFRDCRFLERKSNPIPNRLDLALEQISFSFSCNGQTKNHGIIAYADRVTFLRANTIYQVHERNR